MQRYFSALGILLVCGLTGKVTANPINPYDGAFISEVQMADSIHWTIELFCGGSSGYSIIHKINLPCAVTNLRLRISSSGYIYSIKTRFNSDGVALLTRDSITGVPLNQDISIQARDTIQILDTMWNDSTNKFGAWRFVVRPVKTGNSLVNTAARAGDSSIMSVTYGYNYPFETIRPSIGSRGNYATIHRIYLMNGLQDQLSQVWIYEGVVAPYSGNQLVMGLRTRIISPVFYDDTISLAKYNDDVCFCCDSVPGSGWINYGSAVGYKWTASYNDTIQFINDTVTIYCLGVPVNSPQPVISPPRISFSACQGAAHAVTFMISAPCKVPKGSIVIYSVNGKEVATVKVPAQKKPGTYSYVWGFTEKRTEISGGAYLCKLIIDRIATATLLVTLR